MRLRFNRQEMVDALSVVCNVTTVRTPKEILKCVRMEAQSDALLLSATDLEIGLRYTVTQVEVEKTGDVLVVADTVSRIVRECTDELLSLETIDGVLHVQGVGSHFEIITQAVADFPPISVLEGEPDFTIEYGQLCRLIEWTVFAAARESTRYAINGVLWEVTGERLTLAATDGRRLSVSHGGIKSPTAKSLPLAIVPPRALSLVGRLSAHADALVMVKITGNQLLLRVEGVQIGTSLVEGHFPKYQDVIPTDCNRVVELNTTEFHSALRKAALLTNEESKGIRLRFADSGLTLTSRAPEQGEATITLQVPYQGEPTEIGFNPAFLTDVLRVARGDEIAFAFKGPDRPGVIRSGEDFVYVVMPVNLTSA